MSNPICKQCGKREIEDARTCWATPICFECLPPPKPLPINYPKSMKGQESESMNKPDKYHPECECQACRAWSEHLRRLKARAQDAALDLLSRLLSACECLDSCERASAEHGFSRDTREWLLERGLIEIKEGPSPLPRETKP